MTIEILSLILLAGLCIRWARDLTSEASPSDLTACPPPPGEPVRGKDGLHRPDGGPRRETLVNRLTSTGSLWRAK